MEQYFEDIAETMDGYEEFEKEAWSFKVVVFGACIYLGLTGLSSQHDRLNVERRFSDNNKGDARMQTVKTSDVARLMELFQVRLAIPFIYNLQTRQLRATELPFEVLGIQPHIIGFQKRHR